MIPGNHHFKNFHKEEKNPGGQKAHPVFLNPYSHECDRSIKPQNPGRFPTTGFDQTNPDLVHILMSQVTCPDRRVIPQYVGNQSKTHTFCRHTTGCNGKITSLIW